MKSVETAMHLNMKSLGKLLRLAERYEWERMQPQTTDEMFASMKRKSSREDGRTLRGPDQTAERDLLYFFSH